MPHPLPETQSINGRDYWVDGTYIQDDMGYVYRIERQAHVLVDQGRLVDGIQTFPRMIGYEHVLTVPWNMASSHNWRTQVMYPCDCPRHRGEVKFHASNN